MKFGVCVMADVDEIGFFRHAEALGYDSVWVADSQMLFSDCYAVLALAARQTSRLRLGPGTAICGTRIPPVQVAAVATLNRLAPGRVLPRHRHRQHRDAQHGPAADAGRRVRRIPAGLAALLRGETVDYAFNGATRADQMLMHDETGYMNLQPTIPLYVSGLRAAGDGAGRRVSATGWCSRSRRAARRRRGAGACPAGRRPHRPRPRRLPQLRADQPGAARTGRGARFRRIKAALGPNVMASVYYFYDEVHEKRIEPPPFLARIWKKYCALVEETPPEHRHFRTHEFHYTRLHPGEAELIDAQLIRDTCLVGTADELVERLRDARAQGLEELMFASGNDAKWRVAEDFARQVMARVERNEPHADALRAVLDQRLCVQLPEVVAGVARAAEAAGFESLWGGEHVVLPDPQAPPSPMAPHDRILDPVIALTYCAAVTTRVRLGTGIIILPQRNPLVLAKELASLDALRAAA